MKKTKAGMTEKQRERQSVHHRENGKYAKVNPCYACGKSAGVNYFSHPLTDTGEWNDLALCLCKKCADATCEMVLPEEFLKFCEQFGNAADEAWKKIRK